jgi:hypothetical protein
MPGYHIAAVGDFNGDGRSDVLWAPNTPGADAIIWLMNGDAVTAVGYLPYGAVPTTAWAGDFNGDGMSDILWDTGSGAPILWLMNGLGVISGSLVGASMPGYHIAGVGDFNGDGMDDILWAPNAIGGPAVIWMMAGASVTAVQLMPYGAVPTKAWTGDFSGDGRDDILWDMGSSNPVLWTMDGTSVTAISLVGAAMPGYKIAGVGDFNGDGKTDIIWSPVTAGSAPAIVWLMVGASVIDSRMPSSARLPSMAPR